MLWGEWRSLRSLQLQTLDLCFELHGSALTTEIHLQATTANLYNPLSNNIWYHCWQICTVAIKNCKTRNREWLWFMRTCGIPWHLNHWHQKDHCYVSDITYIQNCCKVCLRNVIQQFRHGGLLVAYRALEDLHSLAGNRGQGWLPIFSKREMVQLDNVISYTDNLQNHTIWKGREGVGWVGGWVLVQEGHLSRTILCCTGRTESLSPFSFLYAGHIEAWLLPAVTALAAQARGPEFDSQKLQPTYLQLYFVSYCWTNI